MVSILIYRTRSSASNQYNQLGDAQFSPKEIHFNLEIIYNRTKFHKSKLLLNFDCMYTLRWLCLWCVWTFDLFNERRTSCSVSQSAAQRALGIWQLRPVADMQSRFVHAKILWVFADFYVQWQPIAFIHILVKRNSESNAIDTLYGTEYYAINESAQNLIRFYNLAVKCTSATAVQIFDSEVAIFFNTRTFLYSPGS